MTAAQPSPNVCAGPFGTVYDFYIERDWLMRLIGRVVWGIDASVLYTSMEAISRAGDGATILDVPCGGGVALRALRPDQDVRYIAVDVSGKMLARAKRRAKRRSLSQVEFAVADMRALTFGDSEADLVVCYSGLHMLDDPEPAVRELARCLKPGGVHFSPREAGDSERSLSSTAGAVIPRHHAATTSATGSTKPESQMW